MGPRVFVAIVMAIELLRLGRTFLTQFDGQYNEDGHLKEFALPILEHRFKAMAGGNILAKTDRRPAVFQSFVVVDAMTGDDLTEQ